MCNLPIKISNTEIVLRAVRDPQHFRSARERKFKQHIPVDFDDINPYRLFRPMAGESTTSLIRDLIGPQQVQSNVANVNGIATISFSVGVVRELKSQDYNQLFEIVDQRECFIGHAGLELLTISDEKLVRPKGTPIDPEVSALLSDLYNKLYKVRIAIDPIENNSSEH